MPHSCLRPAQPRRGGPAASSFPARSDRALQSGGDCHALLSDFTGQSGPSNSYSHTPIFVAWARGVCRSRSAITSAGRIWRHENGHGPCGVGCAVESRAGECWLERRTGRRFAAGLQDEGRGEQVGESKSCRASLACKDEEEQARPRGLVRAAYAMPGARAQEVNAPSLSSRTTSQGGEKTLVSSR